MTIATALTDMMLATSDEQREQAARDFETALDALNTNNPK